MDGVIVDSNPVHTQSWQMYLSRHGIESDESLPQRMLGRHNSFIVRHYFGESLDAAETARHGAAKEALYREMMRPQIRERLVPGIVPFLERHRGAPMGVATNAERENLEFVLREAGLEHFFTARLDGDQITRPKPAPQIYRRMSELLDIAPRNCLVFEDSHLGVDAARAAGMRVVGVSTTHEWLDGADLNIDDFLSTELEPWLAQQAVSE